MSAPDKSADVDPPRRGTGGVLTAIFFGAMIMGAGPGGYLVNGSGPIMGMPAVYVWVVFWYLVQAGAVLTAFGTVWKRS
jgi:hypothetical protein